MEIIVEDGSYHDNRIAVTFEEDDVFLKPYHWSTDEYNVAETLDDTQGSPLCLYKPELGVLRSGYFLLCIVAIIVSIVFKYITVFSWSSWSSFEGNFSKPRTLKSLIVSIHNMKEILTSASELPIVQVDEFLSLFYEINGSLYEQLTVTPLQEKPVGEMDEVVTPAPMNSDDLRVEIAENWEAIMDNINALADELLYKISIALSNNDLSCGSLQLQIIALDKLEDSVFCDNCWKNARVQILLHCSNKEEVRHKLSSAVYDTESLLNSSSHIDNTLVTARILALREAIAYCTVFKQRDKLNPLYTRSNELLEKLYAKVDDSVLSSVSRTSLCVPGPPPLSQTPQYLSNQEQVVGSPTATISDFYGDTKSGSYSSLISAVVKRKSDVAYGAETFSSSGEHHTVDTGNSVKMDSVYYARRIELQQKRVDEMQREVSAARRAHQVFQGNKSPKIIMSKIRDDEMKWREKWKGIRETVCDRLSKLQQRKNEWRASRHVFFVVALIAVVVLSWFTILYNTMERANYSTLAETQTFIHLLQQDCKAAVAHLLSSLQSQQEPDDKSVGMDTSLSADDIANNDYIFKSASDPSLFSLSSFSIPDITRKFAGKQKFSLESYVMVQMSGYADHFFRLICSQFLNGLNLNIALSNHSWDIISLCGQCLWFMSSRASAYFILLRTLYYFRFTAVANKIQYAIFVFQILVPVVLMLGQRFHKCLILAAMHMLLRWVLDMLDYYYDYLIVLLLPRDWIIQYVLWARNIKLTTISYCVAIVYFGLICLTTVNYHLEGDDAYHWSSTWSVFQLVYNCLFHIVSYICGQVVNLIKLP